MARFKPAPRSAVAIAITTALAALVVGLAACSSGASPSTSTVTTQVTAVITATTISTPTASTATTEPVTAPVLNSLTDLAAYYKTLGVADDVVDCYVASLQELGITDVNQLEANQELGLRAADRFDQCIAKNGPLSTLH